MAAFTSGNSEKALQMLIDAGANVNLADKNGVTPLMFAASKGLTEDVKALIHAGADVNVRLSDGRTALDVAQSDEVKALLRQTLPKQPQ